ncbi:MAG: MOSC domain-containing protein [Ignavibacteria bacterium]
MKIISINAGRPREFLWKGKKIQTSIFKDPVGRHCKVSFMNIEGDQQADLKYHGGKDMAVYSYDIENYNYWKTVIERDSWESGLFGENLTTEGLTDEKVRIGNIYEIGNVQLQAIQPRFPCFKLNIRFQRKDMIEKFYELKRFGTYFRVIKEGKISVKDDIKLIEKSKFNVTIRDVTDCKTSKGADQKKLKLILDSPWLPLKVKDSLRIYLK